jgi:MFS superfamily sulfate permease-like transporter
LGTSKQLSIGPDALSSILVGLILQEVADAHPEFTADELVQVVHFLALLAGIFLFIIGLFRFGFLDNVLSRPLLGGFVNAIAVFIAMEQLDTLFGLPSANPLGLHGVRKIPYTIEHMKQTNVIALAIGICSIVFLFGFRFMKRKLGKRFSFLKYIPEILVLMILGILISSGVGLNTNYNVTILGQLDGKFPTPKWPGSPFGFSGVTEYLDSSIIIAIIGFVESSVVAKIYATKHNYFVSPNRELIALGTTNFVASFFSTYPTFGSLPRSSVADLMGAQSQLFSIIACILIMIAMLVLAPVFYYLPKVLMSGIIIVAAYGLIETEDLIFLWKMRVSLP